MGRLIWSVCSRPQSGHSLLPHGFGNLNYAPELCVLIRFGEWIACGGAGKAALRTDGETVDIDVPGCFVDAPLEHVEAFDLWDLAADEAQYHALFLRHCTQRREPPLRAACRIPAGSG